MEHPFVSHQMSVHFKMSFLVPSFGPKYQRKNLTISALESKKWWNQQNKGTFQTAQTVQTVQTAQTAQIAQTVLTAQTVQTAEIAQTTQIAQTFQTPKRSKRPKPPKQSKQWGYMVKSYKMQQTNEPLHRRS